MRTKITLLIVIIFTFFTGIFAQNKGIYKGFTGGMFIHTGYIGIIPDYSPYTSIKGTIFGLGGKIAFNFTDYFRIGSEGYSTTCKYDKEGSFFKIGWGGILAETGIMLDNFRPFTGITLGGGRAQNLLIINGNVEDTENDEVIYRSYGAFIYSPYLGMEYHLGNKLTFVLKSDLIRTISNNFEGNNNSGIRIYFGVMFRK